MCIDIADCNDKGFCIQGECLCDVAWFGDTCHDNLKNFLPNAFVTYKVIFLIIYSLIAVVSFYRLYSKIKKESHLLNRNNIIFTIKALRSPYNLTMLSILGIAITRILWLSIDPFSYEDIIHRSVERLLFESTYSLIFFIYAIVLWVWYSIYDELSQKNEKRSVVRLRCFKTKVGLFVFIVVGSQLTTSVLKGFHDNEYRLATMTIYAMLFIVLVIVTLEYIIYGWFLYKCITDQEETINDKYDKLQSAVAQSGQAAAAYVSRKGTSSVVSRQESRKRTSIRIEERERSKHSYLDDSEKNDMMQPHQNPDTPGLDRSGSRNDSLSRNPSDALKRIAFKHSSQKIILEGMEEMEDESSFGVEIPPLRGGKYQTVPPSYKDLTQKSLHTFYSLKKSPELPSKKLGSLVDSELFLERQIKEIVRRHEKHLKPVEIVEPEYDNIAGDRSVIIDDSEDVMWDYISEEEAKRQEEQIKEKEDRREEIKHAVAQMRMKALVVKYMTAVKKNVSDAFQMKLLDDPTYLKNYQEITKNDKVIVKKIMSLTVIAISLEVLFGVFTILIFYSPVLQSPPGMISSMWLTGFLEVFAIFAIFLLFSIVQTQEKENLRLIMRIGQNKNRINQLYGFVLPKYLRQEESKRRLEKSINQMTAKYIKSWTTVHG